MKSLYEIQLVGDTVEKIDIDLTQEQYNTFKRISDVTCLLSSMQRSRVFLTIMGIEQ